MVTLTITAHGQVTLRRELLAHLGVGPGDGVTIEKLTNGRIELRAARPSGEIAAVFDLLKRPNGPALTVEEIGEIAAKGWAGEP
jgi:bifunctional DNA-binding transcriptional regulator/antitoxin component of YhaV-PrlF toxin-antitoxin module